MLTYIGIGLIIIVLICLFIFNKNPDIIKFWGSKKTESTEFIIDIKTEKDINKEIICKIADLLSEVENKPLQINTNYHIYGFGVGYKIGQEFDIVIHFDKKENK